MEAIKCKYACIYVNLAWNCFRVFAIAAVLCVSSFSFDNANNLGSVEVAEWTHLRDNTVIE